MSVSFVSRLFFSNTNMVLMINMLLQRFLRGNNFKNLLISSCRYSTKVEQAENCSIDLKSILEEKIPKEQERIKKIKKDLGDVKVGEVTVGMIYGGMRDITAMIWETSHLDHEEGIRLRGLSLPEVQKLLPKAEGGCEIIPEGVFWLLLTGDIPTVEQTKWLSREWALRAEIPDYIITLLNNFPKTLHPMSQFSAAITALNMQSKFLQAFNVRVKKTDYWKYIYEDAMDLIGKLPVIAAIIYKNCFKDGGDIGAITTCNDWSLNFGSMLGYDNKEFIELLRLYLSIHCDHEGGNVSAHAVHLVGSALSDPYLSFAAGMNGLAGPLHGLANQEVLIWLIRLQKELGEAPTDEQLKDFVWKTLKSGKVIPGFGHAVLRKTDPRYTAQQKFAETHLPEYPMYKLVASLYKVVPPILTELGKVKNPWPNVDAHSGVLLQYYGMKEMNFYTVLFGVSRALGVMAQMIWSRALGFPIERPKSITTDLLLKKLKC